VSRPAPQAIDPAGPNRFPDSKYPRRLSDNSIMDSIPTSAEDGPGAGMDAAGPPVERRRRTERRSGGERRSGLDRRRGPGRRRGDLRREAEEGEISGDVREFLMAIDEYKRVNERPFPSWSEVFEIVHYLGYRKVAPRASHVNAPSDPNRPSGG